MFCLDQGVRIPGVRAHSGLEDLPEEVREAGPPVPASIGVVRPLEQIEKDYILASLQLNGGNQTRTAEQLEIGSATLYRKLKSYGLIAGRRAPGDDDRVDGE